MPMTHAELVALAGKWLAKRCPVVITEMASTAWEEPDAIGWHGGGSLLVECKATRADLRADKDKPHRAAAADGRPLAGLGNERWYLYPKGMADRDDPLFAFHWGQLEVAEKGRVLQVRAPQRMEADLHAERLLLLSCIRRLGVASSGGTSVKVYTVQTKCRATVSVELDGESSAGGTAP